MYDDLKGKTVLITGGASGLGANTARHFVEAEAEVFFCDVKVDEGEQLADELGATATFDTVNMNESSEVKKWVDRCGSVRGAINVLANNVGDDTRSDFISCEVEEIKKQFELNYYSALFATHASVPYMMTSGGSIVNYGSVTYPLGEKNLSGYVPAKAALLGLTRTLARELGPQGIRVNAISPGWVMTEKQLNERITPELQEMLREWQCDPNLLNPDDISRVVLFLASNASSAITGQNILADRGWRHL